MTLSFSFFIWSEKVRIFVDTCFFSSITTLTAVLVGMKALTAFCLKVSGGSGVDATIPEK